MLCSTFSWDYQLNIVAVNFKHAEATLLQSAFEMLQTTPVSFAEILVNYNRHTWCRIAEDWHLYQCSCPKPISWVNSMFSEGQLRTLTTYNVVSDLICTIHQVQQDKQVQLTPFYSYKWFYRKAIITQNTTKFPMWKWYNLHLLLQNWSSLQFQNFFYWFVLLCNSDVSR
jgi:hypothetical protein